MRIKDDDELDMALYECGKLMEEIATLEDRLEIVSIAIEEYEDIHYPIAVPSWWTRIKFRLGQRFSWLGW